MTQKCPPPGTRIEACIVSLPAVSTPYMSWVCVCVHWCVAPQFGCGPLVVGRLVSQSCLGGGQDVRPPPLPSRFALGIYIDLPGWSPAIKSWKDFPVIMVVMNRPYWCGGWSSPLEDPCVMHALRLLGDQCNNERMRSFSCMSVFWSLLALEYLINHVCCASSVPR